MVDTITGRRSYPTRANRIVPNVLPNIILIDRNQKEAGYLEFVSQLRSQRTVQEKITWDVDEFAPIIDTLSAAVASTTQTLIPVSNPGYYLPNEIWQNQRTDEIIQIQEINIGLGNIQVVRAVTALNSSGGSAAATMNSGDQLNRIASLVGENSARQVTRTTTPSEVFNYCQQFRKDLSLSRRDRKREFDNDDEMPYQKEKMLKEFRTDLDRTFLFGEKARFTDESGDDVTATGGIRQFITDNIYDVGGTLFKSNLDQFLVEQGLRFGSMNKVLFASTQVILAFTAMADSISRFDIDISGNKDMKLGTSVLSYMAPNGGELLIVEDRNISEQRNGEAYGVDMDQLMMREFSNNGLSGSMELMEGTQDPDDIGTVDTVIGDMGITYGYNKAHFTLKNVEGGSYSASIV